MNRRRSSDDRTTWRHYLRYRFDGLLARGTWAVLLWLGIVTFAVVLVASFLLRRGGVTLAGSENAGWFEDFWQSLLRTLDTGTMAGDIGARQRIVALGVTIFGLLVFGTLIGVIASGVEAQIDRMKRGRSAVVESDHIVVLGASSLLPDVVDQLCRANAGRGIALVVMADGDPAEMGERVRQGIESTFGNRLVFRDGDPTRLADLDLVRLRTCRTVVVLNGDGDHVGDARAVHTVLAAREALGDLRTPIVVVLDESAVAATVAASLDDQVHPLVVSQAVARNVVFALRERGLGEVMAELTDFRGADIYVKACAELVGTLFGDVVAGASAFRPIGLLHDDGSVEIQPALDAEIGPGDRIVVVAHESTASLDLDRDAIARTRVAPAVDRPVFRQASAVNHVLMVGWSGLGRPLLTGWAMSAGSGSTVEIVYDPRVIEVGDIDVPDLDGIAVTLTPVEGDVATMSRRVASEITAIVLLAYRDHLPATGGRQPDVARVGHDPPRPRGPGRVGAAAGDRVDRSRQRRARRCPRHRRGDRHAGDGEQDPRSARRRPGSSSGVSRALRPGRFVVPPGTGRAPRPRRYRHDA